MDEHSSSPMGNTELFLALTWLKQLNNNIPNQGTTTAQFHNGSDSNYAQSQTKDKQTPSMDRGEHGQQIGIPQWPKTNLDTTANTKTWGRQQPQSNNSEYASHMGKRPKQSVREEKLAPNSKMHGKDIPDFCVRISAYA